ncbi:unnamed protein product [Amoebophrya sp. A25]|nr:unnamed protein product [Amoebophrya sp. A25]|eukprot:GSA25T00005093001.1
MVEPAKSPAVAAANADAASEIGEQVASPSPAQGVSQNEDATPKAGSPPGLGNSSTSEAGQANAVAVPDKGSTSNKTDENKQSPGASTATAEGTKEEEKPAEAEGSSSSASTAAPATIGSSGTGSGNGNGYANRREGGYQHHPASLKKFSKSDIAEREKDAGRMVLYIQNVLSRFNSFAVLNTLFGNDLVSTHARYLQRIHEIHEMDDAAKEVLAEEMRKWAESVAKAVAKDPAMHTPMCFLDARSPSYLQDLLPGPWLVLFDGDGHDKGVYASMVDRRNRNNDLVWSARDVQYTDRRGVPYPELPYEALDEKLHPLAKLSLSFFTLPRIKRAARNVGHCFACFRDRQLLDIFRELIGETRAFCAQQRALQCSFAKLRDLPDLKEYFRYEVTRVTNENAFWFDDEEFEEFCVRNKKTWIAAGYGPDDDLSAEGSSAKGPYPHNNRSKPHRSGGHWFTQNPSSSARNAPSSYSRHGGGHRPPGREYHPHDDYRDNRDRRPPPRGPPRSNDCYPPREGRYRESAGGEAPRDGGYGRMSPRDGPDYRRRDGYPSSGGYFNSDSRYYHGGNAPPEQGGYYTQQSVGGPRGGGSGNPDNASYGYTNGKAAGSQNSRNREQRSDPRYDYGFVSRMMNSRGPPASPSRYDDDAHAQRGRTLGHNGDPAGDNDRFGGHPGSGRHSNYDRGGYPQQAGDGQWHGYSDPQSKGAYNDRLHSGSTNSSRVAVTSSSGSRRPNDRNSRYVSSRYNDERPPHGQNYSEQRYRMPAGRGDSGAYSRQPNDQSDRQVSYFLNRRQHDEHGDTDDRHGAAGSSKNYKGEKFSGLATSEGLAVLPHSTVYKGLVITDAENHSDAK